MPAAQPAPAEHAAAGLPDLSATLREPHAGSFLRLGSASVTRLPATPLPSPHLAGFSPDTAALLGLDPGLRDAPGFADLFCGNPTRDWPADGLPYASVYSGHQFGVWAGQLGDGRALTIGELEHAGEHYEVQLKGAGLTPYSRMGDGRAVLRSSIREFLGSEAMFHLGIPTTRALCLVASPAPVRREEIETAAVVTRVAPSFIRFGHFEHWFANDRNDLLETLADQVIARFYPDCRSAEDPYLALLEAVTRRTAALIAQWQAVGFCHGVMNTDNMSMLGLTLDYGPFGFIDAFDANHICNHTDTQGRYAYRMQPRIAHWNCYCLAQALLPLVSRHRTDLDDKARTEHAVEAAQAVLGRFGEWFGPALEQAMRAKLGLALAHEDDAALANQLLEVMHGSHADFTLTFRRLAQVSSQDARHDGPVRDLFVDRAAFDAWAERYRARLALEQRGDAARAEAMQRVNPKYVLRNHLAETAIRRAKEQDFSEIERLRAILSRPFDEQPEHEAYAGLPPEWAQGLEVSCSS